MTEGYESKDERKGLSRFADKDGHAKTALPIATFAPDPRHFIKQPLNIPSRIPDYYETYGATECKTLSMCGFPTSVLDSVERIGVRAYTTKKARFNPVIGCIAACAIGVWTEHGIIRHAIEVSDEFKKVGKTVYTKSRSLLIGNFYKRATIAQIAITGGGQRKNAMIPASLRDAVSSLASDLGVEVGAFGIMTIMSIICREDCVLPELATEYAECVKSFLQSIDDRTIGQEALMRGYR
jgi:hypothetical protein